MYLYRCTGVHFPPHVGGIERTLMSLPRLPRPTGERSVPAPTYGVLTRGVDVRVPTPGLKLLSTKLDKNSLLYPNVSYPVGESHEVKGPRVKLEQ